MLISVFKIASLFHANCKCNFPCHCSFIYLLLPSTCARTEENVETFNDLVLSQQDTPQTHRTVVRYHGRRVFIGRLCPGLFVRTCIWNVSRVVVHRSWQTRTALLAWSALIYATDFVFFTDEKMFSVASPDSRQNKVSGRLRELLKKKLGVFFSSALRGLSLPGRLSTVPVPRNFFNSLLTQRFVQLFSGNSSVNLFAVYK